MLSININGRTSVLEEDDCVKFLAKYDFCCLNEVKGCCNMNVAGFLTLRSSMLLSEFNRGGVAVLIKHYLWRAVRNIDSRSDSVWFYLDNLPNVVIGAFYITPYDSPLLLNAVFCRHLTGVIDWRPEFMARQLGFFSK